MTIAEVPAEARAAVLARRRKEIDELDYRRELRRLEEHGYSQRDISKWLGIAQPSVQSALRTAAKVPMPLDGFSGATPYEICQRYAAGFIGRPQLVDELTRFPYVEGGHTDGYDSLIVDPAGTWSEVDDAVRRGLIGDDIYEEVFNRRHGLEQEQPAASPESMKMIEAPDTRHAMVGAFAILGATHSTRSLLDAIQGRGGSVRNSAFHGRYASGKEVAEQLHGIGEFVITEAVFPSDDGYEKVMAKAVRIGDLVVSDAESDEAPTDPTGARQEQ